MRQGAFSMWLLCFSRSLKMTFHSSEFCLLQTVIALCFFFHNVLKMGHFPDSDFCLFYFIALHLFSLWVLFRFHAHDCSGAHRLAAWPLRPLADLISRKGNASAWISPINLIRYSHSQPALCCLFPASNKVGGPLWVCISHGSVQDSVLSLKFHSFLMHVTVHDSWLGACMFSTRLTFTLQTVFVNTKKKQYLRSAMTQS